VSLKRRPPLDIRPRFRYICHRISLNYRTAAGDPGCPERVRFPRAGARHLRSRAANGKTPGRHYDRSATLSLDWDRSPSANAWRRPRPRKRVLELSGGVGSLPQVPRWNRRQASALRSARAAPVWRGPSEGMRLAAFCFLIAYLYYVARVERSETRGGIRRA